MRHYLNDKLKAQIDVNGQQCYPIYFTFSANRQTFKIKSRILNRPYSKNQFEAFNNSNDPLLTKDQEIISHCINESTTTQGVFSINQFKESYAVNCTSLFFWLNENARSPGQMHMDDFMFGQERESELQQSLRRLEDEMGIDGYTVLSYFNRFYEFMKENNDFGMYTIVYDWEHGLHEVFQNFIHKSGRIPPEHVNLMPFINRLVTII